MFTNYFINQFNYCLVRKTAGTVILNVSCWHDHDYDTIVLILVSRLLTFSPKNPGPVNIYLGNDVTAVISSGCQLYKLAKDNSNTPTIFCPYLSDYSSLCLERDLCYMYIFFIKFIIELINYIKIMNYT